MPTLLEALAAEGAAEARAVLDRARAEADAIAVKSLARLGDELERRKRERAADLAGKESAVRIEARGGARRSALGARQAVVSRVLEAATALLAAASTRAWLETELQRVQQYLPDGKATLRCAAKDVASVKKFAASRPDTGVVADDTIAAGVIAEMADGSLVVDGTLASRLERMRGALSIEIVTALEGAR